MAELSSNSFEFETDSDVIEYFITKGWTDGLPIIPPTIQRVTKFLETVPNISSDVIGHEPVKNREITVEKIAIATLAHLEPRSCRRRLFSLEDPIKVNLK